MELVLKLSVRLAVLKLWYLRLEVPLAAARQAAGHRPAAAVRAVGPAAVVRHLLLRGCLPGQPLPALQEE